MLSNISNKSYRYVIISNSSVFYNHCSTIIKQPAKLQAVLLSVNIMLSAFYVFLFMNCPVLKSENTFSYTYAHIIVYPDLFILAFSNCKLRFLAFPFSPYVPILVFPGIMSLVSYNDFIMTLHIESKHEIYRKSDGK